MTQPRLSTCTGAAGAAYTEVAATKERITVGIVMRISNELDDGRV